MYNYFLYATLFGVSLYIGPTMTMLIQSLYKLYNNTNKENISDVLFYISMYTLGLWDTMIYCLIIKLYNIILDSNSILDKINNFKTTYGDINTENFKIIKSECEYYIDYFNAIGDKLVEIGYEYIGSPDMKLYTDYYNLFIPQIVNDQPIPNTTEYQNMDPLAQLFQQPMQLDAELNKLILSLGDLNKISKDLDNIKPVNLTRAQRRLLKKQKKNKQ